MKKEQLLRDPDVYPTDEILKEALGSSYGAYTAFIGKLPELEIELQWRYYTDGKAWLAKGIYKWTGTRGGQKEVCAFWLSAWEGFFKVTIYIPEKNRIDALSLLLDDEIKKMIADSKQIGKLKFFPLIFDLLSDELFQAIYIIINFRKKLK